MSKRLCTLLGCVEAEGRSEDHRMRFECRSSKNLTFRGVLELSRPEIRRIRNVAGTLEAGRGPVLDHCFPRHWTKTTVPTTPTSSIRRSKKKVTMPLATSFKEHFIRATTGTIGDGNVEHFNAAMNPETSRREAAKAFNNAEGSFFYAQNGKLKIIHGLTDFGNSFIRRESKVGGHTGMSDIAFVGLVDVDMALSLTSFDTPTGNEISNCTTELAIRELQPGDPHGTYEGAFVFFPAPFVQQAVIESGSTCPVELIFSVREKYREIIVGLTPSIIDTIDAHVEQFEQYCWGIQDGELNTDNIFIPQPDDTELRNFSKEYHASRIAGPAGGSTTTTPGVGGGMGTTTTTMTLGAGGRGDPQGSLEILAHALTRTVEEQASSASILERMHQHAVKKDLDKKDKSVDWHPAMKKLVCFASSVDGIIPAGGIPQSYKKIINAPTIGHSEVELAAQMRASGHEEIEWDLPFLNALRNGLLEYDKMDTPSNFSIFLIRVKDPTTLNEQHARGMELHILESGKDNNKDIRERIEASRKRIEMPTTIEDLITIVKGFGAIAAILFGASSLLPTNLRLFARELNTNRTLVKGKIAMDKTLTSKILYIIDSRTQLFLKYLMKAVELEHVSPIITDFMPMANDLMLGQLQVTLPATFTQPKITKDDENEHDEPPRGGGKRRKKGAGGSGPPLGEVVGDRRDNNENVPPEFRLKDNESYKDLIVNKYVQKRPKWNEDCTMCTRWWTIGKCYKDCNNVESHVSSADLPAVKKTAFLEFLEICRRG